MNNKKEWIIAIGFIVALSIGTSVVRKLLGSLNTWCLQSGGNISPIEGAIVQAFELVIIALIGFLGIAVPLQMAKKEIINISWKIAVISILVGLVIGFTYTAGLQNLSCGFIHSM